ncbi:MAG: glycosyltransferase family 4 protein [Synechococcaceae cyanobacterium SM2_3_1]|nr:glycosyltransferase family 4 protein [Synechococcaceae cyanobacterium SM2_3_1]
MASAVQPRSSLSSKTSGGTRPRVLHIVWDRKVGGVKSTLNGLIHSSLSKSFEFQVLALREDQAVLNSRRSQPEIIICHQPARFKTILDLILLRMLNPQARLILHEHGYSQGYEQHNVRFRSRFHLALKLCMALVDQVVAISNAQASWLLSHGLVKPEKLSMIRQCPPLAAFLTLPDKSPQQPLRVVAYGRLCPQKGLDVLLKALSLIPEVPLQLLIGGVGPDADKLQKLARDLKQEIIWLGRVDDVPALLAECDVVAIPSRWEPWGNVCVEAKAAGKPVLAAAVDGLVEQVVDCGWLLPPDQPQAWAEALRQLPGFSGKQLKIWGEKGREDVRDNWDIYISSWGDLLTTVHQSSDQA